MLVRYNNEKIWGDVFMNHQRMKIQAWCYTHWKVLLSFFLTIVALAGYNWHHSVSLNGPWSTLYFKANWQDLSIFLSPIVSVATVVGILIVLFQFNRAIENREEDSENERFKNTQLVFNFFITDLIPLTHKVEKATYTNLFATFEVSGYTNINIESFSQDAMDTLITNSQLDVNIDEVFNKLEYQAWLILSDNVDDVQLLDMFSKSIVAYCTTNNKAYQVCQKSRKYTNLDKLLIKWGESDEKS